MRTMFSKNTLAAFFSIALAFTFSCSNSDDPGDGGSQIVIYIGISGGNEYVLKIDSPKTGESYTLTVGGKTSTGTVSSFANGIFTLKPSNSETTFTATILGSDLVAMGGTITWNDNTTSEAPSTLTPPSTSGSSSSNGSGDGNYTDKGNNISSYSTKTIGTQVWMTENLNYNVTGSKCYGEDGYNITLTSAEIQSNCDKYGRLYNWATAMALPSDCNETSCSEQIGTKHQGICPSGWHIPSDTDWDALFTAVGGSSTASRYLKAKEGWNNCGPSGSGNLFLCEDTHGFSALPGGYGGYVSSSMNAYFSGDNGYWMSATERSSHTNSTWSLLWAGDSVHDSSYIKTLLNSVRCVKD